MVKVKIKFENKEVEEYFVSCTQIDNIAIIDVEETGNHLGQDVFDDNFVDSANNNIIYAHIDDFLNLLRNQLKEVIDLKIEDEFLKISYKEWKESKEKEMKKWEEDNYRIIYPYQDGYDYYSKSPEWTMYGDFCFFVRISKFDEPKKINEKYNHILLINDDVFKGFCLDEMNRIHIIKECMNGYENGLKYARKIFKYSGTDLEYQMLNDKHKKIFNECYNDFLTNNIYELEITKKIEDHFDNIPSEEEIYQQIVDEMSEEEIKQIEKEIEEDLKKTKEKVKEFVKEWRRLCKKYDSFDEKDKSLNELVDMWMNNYYELYFMEDHYECIECDGGKKYAQYYCYNVGICPAEEVELWNK